MVLYDWQLEQLEIMLEHTNKQRLVKLKLIKRWVEQTATLFWKEESYNSLVMTQEEAEAVFTELEKEFPDINLSIHKGVDNSGGFVYGIKITK